jgi:hypothetical protein
VAKKPHRPPARRHPGKVALRGVEYAAIKTPAAVPLWGQFGGTFDKQPPVGAERHIGRVAAEGHEVGAVEVRPRHGAGHGRRGGDDEVE